VKVAHKNPEDFLGFYSLLLVEMQILLFRNSAEKCSAKSGPMTLGKARLRGRNFSNYILKTSSEPTSVNVVIAIDRCGLLEVGKIMGPGQIGVPPC
jgi:hypothetical protein